MGEFESKLTKEAKTNIVSSILVDIATKGYALELDVELAKKLGNDSLVESLSTNLQSLKEALAFYEDKLKQE